MTDTVPPPPFSDTPDSRPATTVAGSVADLKLRLEAMIYPVSDDKLDASANTQSTDNFVDDGLSIPPLNPELSVEAGPAPMPTPISKPTAQPVHLDAEAVAIEPTPLNPSTLAHVAPVNHDAAPKEVSSSDARCIVLMGAHGGAGTSSLAIQMAYELALKSQNQNKHSRAQSGAPQAKVCLIDLDFEAGVCATYLDLPPSLSRDDLAGGAERIDPSLTQALMSTHSSGVAVLGARFALGGNDQVNTETVLALLDAASQLYDYIVIDMPRLWRPWTQAAMAAADHVALVSELTIPALHMTRQRMSAVEAAVELSRPCEVILNRVERRSFRNSLRVADAAKVLRRDVSGVICVDLDTTREAINCGEPVGAIRSEARYVKDVRTLLSDWQLLGEDTVRPARERRKMRA